MEVAQKAFCQKKNEKLDECSEVWSNLFLQDNIPYGRDQQLDLGVGYSVKYVYERLTHVVVEEPFSLTYIMWNKEVPL